MPYRIEYSLDAEYHLRTLTTRQQRIVLDTVDKQLVHQPTVETRNRKPMRPNPMSCCFDKNFRNGCQNNKNIAPWELRIGNLRVYYDVEEEPEPVVYIRAVGVKERNRVRIGREVIEL